MAEYIIDPLSTDPDALIEDGQGYLETKWPNWSPADGNLETWMIRVGARMVAEARDVASDVPEKLLQTVGDKIHGFPALAATASIVGSTWTLIENPDGRTIEAGTLVGITDGNDNLHIFEVATSVFVAATVLTTGVGAVTLRATSEGAETTGIGGAGVEAQPIDALGWLDTITLTGTTAGGADEEAEADYLDRLVTKMTLLTPRPILPKDFALLAKDIAAENGVSARAATIDNYIPGINEKQTVGHSATGGTFTLTFEAQTTAAINWNESNATLQTKLEALSNIAPGDIVITGGPLPATVTVEFTGALKESNRTQMTVGTNSLTGGGGAGSLLITTSQGGVAPITNAERALTIAMLNASTGADLDPTLKALIDSELQALRELNFIVNIINPTRFTAQATFVGTAKPGSVPASVEVAAEAALAAFFDPATWGTDTEAGEWINKTTILQQDLSVVLKNTAGFDAWTTLTFAVNGGAQGTANINLPGVFPVPQVGGHTIAGTVT